MAPREKKDFTASGKPITHGLASSYNNHGCGCPACKAAWAKYISERGYVQKHREKKRQQKKSGVQIKL